MARGVTAVSRRRRLHGLEFARRGGEMLMGRGGIWQFRLRLRRHRHARRGRLRRLGLRRRRHLQLRRNGQGARRAQVALDHRQPIDHMAERAVDGFQRILGAAVGFRLAEADVGHLALDHVGDAAVERLRRAGIAVVFGQRDHGRMLVFEMAQDVLQRVLDPAEIAGAGFGRCFDPLQQIRHALFEMGEGRCVVVADRHAVEAVGQRPQRAFEMFGVAAAAGRSRLSSVEVSAAMRASRLANESLLPSRRAR